MTKSTLSSVYRCSKLSSAGWWENEAVFGYNEAGELSICILDIAPYLITIYHRSPHTIVEERVKDVSGKLLKIERRKVLDVARALELPWHNKEQVVERIKTLVLFS
jgi:hypothetical protein